MKKLLGIVALSFLLALPSLAGTITLYNNLTPNNSMAMTSRPSNPFGVATESADDFVLGQHSSLTNASFIGIFVPGTVNNFSVSQVVVEIYRIFPQDSDTTRTINVPTRTNSPSDVEFADRDSAGAGLTFTTSVLNGSFTALNSVQPGGIHPKPSQTTGGNGPLTGEEALINVNFATPISLDPGHYFFVPQVELTNGAEFYWLSASRPISGAGTTPFPTGVTDLQTWIRDDNLAPDWLRVGTDIVGGTTPPTFNAAFSLRGTVAEPSSLLLLLSGGMGIFGMRKARVRQ
jgi:hypothetical protein